MEKVIVQWDFEPSVIVGCTLLFAAYVATNGWNSTRAAFFLAGDAFLLLALVSPIDVLADHYLFSAHMVQHLLLVLVVPPLLLMGVSESFVNTLLRARPIAQLEKFLSSAPVAWTGFNLALWVWHLPALYDATLTAEWIHILEHLVFLTTATIFWWPLVTPHEPSRLNTAPSVVYLFTAALSSSLLGILITFARPGLYSAYSNPTDSFGILALIRNSWELDPATDQQLGGLIMWVAGGFVFLGAILVVLHRWYSEYQFQASASANK